MAEKKITKKEYFAMVAEIVNGSDAENKAELMEFIQKQVEALDKKADKAKERAAEKRAAGDELYATVVACLTAEGQTREDILAQVEGEDLSVAKIGARLTQAIKNGVAVKESIKVEGKNKTVYKLAD